ncbi:MAG TPA: apolipoprotein N-acyltransferase [Stellaceae bacterium]|nr:apolipoprotein N-acyltransferase [Stellaceae bacterium]
MGERPGAAISVLFHTAGPLSPVQRAARSAAAQTGWSRHGLAIALGALAAVALPPFDFAPALIVSFSGLVWLEDGSANRRQSFALGWNFGFGFFVAGLYWIAAALLVDAARFWWLVPFAVLGVPAGLAIFTALALLLCHEICQRLGLGGAARILVLAACWAGAEWLRGHVLTGFPWNLIGYAWAGGFPGGIALLQSTAYVGIYGLSLLTVLAAALPARLGDLTGGRRAAPLAALLIVAALAGGGALRLAGDRDAMVPGLNLRLVQPSIPQSLKNDPAADAANFRRLLALTATPARVPPNLVIWPEAGAPPFLERNPAARREIAASIPPGAVALVGTVRTDPLPERPQHIWNSLEAIDSSGQMVAYYDKSHLVPFGEYVPLRGWLPINKITPGTIDFSAGDGPRTLTIKGIPPFSPLICYEAIFPGAVIDDAHRPDWLLNITNDAWYGFTSGPFQHLAIARTRAVEEGLPLVRDGNNGISAVFDANGRVLEHLDLDAIGVLDTRLPRALPPTLYEAIGDGGFAAMLVALLALAGAKSLGRRRRLEP